MSRAFWLMMCDGSLASCSRSSLSLQNVCDSDPEAMMITLRSTLASAAPIARPTRRKSSVSPVWHTETEIQRLSSPLPRYDHRLSDG